MRNPQQKTWLTTTYERLESAAELATMCETQAKETMKSYYDRGARLTNYEVGDQVLILKPSTKVKLMGTWQGPFTVVQKLSETTYKVKKSKNDSKTRTYHVNFKDGNRPQLCVCTPRCPRTWMTCPAGKSLPRSTASRSVRS